MLDELFPFNWSDFHFLRPQFLWGFIGVGLLLILGLFNLRERVKWKKFIAPHLRPYVISKGSGRMKLVMHLLLILGISCGILALSGPTWKKVKVPGQTLETPMVILLDLSQSMMAEDIQPNRLERAKFKINDLIKANPGARIALIGFAGTAHTIVPLTRDYKIIKTHIETLSPKVMPFPGSDLQAAMTKADTLMSVTSAPGTILIFSDDFDNAGFELLKDYATASENKIDIMPMNTPSGSDVPSYLGRVVRNNGEPVHSALNSAVLSQINSLENVTVHRLTLDESDVQLIAKNVSENLKFTEKDKEKKDEWRDAGLLFALPVAFIALLWFRKGWVVYTILLLTFSSCSKPNQVNTFADLWYTKDYQGHKQSNDGHYEAAAALYEDPLRKGIAYFKAEDYDDAVKAFSQDTTAMGAYNLGLAYFQSGDYAAAQLAFGQAVKLDPEMQAAQNNMQQMQKFLAETNQMDPSKAKEAAPQGQAKNEQNKSMEDLSGGGQEATKKDMEKERLQETVSTDIRKGKEMDQVPDDIEISKPDNSQKILMQKIDDDPARFLQKKFEFEVKKHNIKPKTDGNSG